MTSTPPPDSARREQDPDPIEPEVIPPDGQDPEGSHTAGAAVKDLPNWIAALLIDAVDLATWGAIGIRTGWIVGAISALAIGTAAGWPWRKRLLIALLAALYCTVPGTSFIPLATILLLLRPRSYGQRR